VKKKIFIREAIFISRKLRPMKLIMEAKIFYKARHSYMIVAIGLIKSRRDKLEEYAIENYAGYN
jgi:hypothetical protein